MKQFDANLVCIERKIIKIARDMMRLRGKPDLRVVDIGCYKRPVSGFVLKEFPQSSFLGVDPDQDAIDWLIQRGIDGCSFTDFQSRGVFDFSFALEVLEHISANQSQNWLHSVVSQTSGAAFFTTPNFSGFTQDRRDEVRRHEDLNELRYLPDHLKTFRPASSNPHDHRQAFTGRRLADDLGAVLPHDWEFSVFEAWPWKIEDISDGRTFVHAFKLFAVAWNTSNFPADVYERTIGPCLEKKAKVVGLNSTDLSSVLFV